MLCVVTANDVEHAVHILCMLINSNQKLSQTFANKFKPKYAEQLDNDSNILTSIRTFIADDKKTTNRPKEQNEALKAIVTACKYQTPHSKYKLHQFLGTTRHMLNKSPNNDISSYNHVTRSNEKCNNNKIIRQKMVLKYCHDNESSYVDTSYDPVNVVSPDGVKEKHAKRIWLAPSISDQYSMFLKSDMYKDYCQSYPLLKISRYTFFQCICKCV